MMKMIGGTLLNVQCFVRVHKVYVPEYLYGVHVEARQSKYRPQPAIAQGREDSNKVMNEW